MSDAPQVAAAAAPDTTAKHVDQKVALTPPTSEDMDRGKRAGSSSDLSELDFDDDEDIGEVEPAYYWDGGKIPVFHPVRCRSAARLCKTAIAVAARLCDCARANSLDRPWPSSGASKSSSIRLTSTA